MPVVVTSIYAALGAVLVVVLALRVVAARRAHRVGLGDGGQVALNCRIRAHANTIENLPLALLLLLLLELSGVAHGWLHGLGALLIVARGLHAIGLSSSAGLSFGRFYGTLVTWLLLLGMAAWLLLAATGIWSPSAA